MENQEYGHTSLGLKLSKDKGKEANQFAAVVDAARLMFADATKLYITGAASSTPSSARLQLPRSRLV